MITPGFQVQHWLNHFVYIDGALYREAIATRLLDGERWVIAVKEDLR